MKTTNFFEMTNDELQVKLAALKQELFDLRFKHKAGNLDNNSKIAATKKDIANGVTGTEDVVKENVVMMAMDLFKSKL